MMVKMGYVWDRTVETLGERLAVILPFALLGIFLPSFVTTVLAGLRETAGPGLKISLSLVSFVASLLSLWVQLAIIVATVDVRRGAGEMSRIASRRLLPLIGVFLLVGIAAGLLLSPSLILLALGGLDPMAIEAGQVTLDRLTPAYVGLAGLYGLVAFIVILFVSARLAPLSAVVAEERRGAGAITRALRLTRGLTWRLVGVILLYGIVSVISTLAVQTVFGTVLRLFDSGTGVVTMTGIVTAGATAAVSTVFTVLATVFCARLYVAVVRADEPPAAVGTPSPFAMPQDAARS
ncbi:glycerophosphoryl diester phosphodiesterase membrane domain-containing protein [Sphingomonas sp. Leaf33]|uniref:glycerophosphoryl diester phosphodiesterase membrane domain-containing protein n=1 Tax=Sphingomonas sp. Leaf33 TaxID=1736215 RepID=UPI0012E13382|nr:glycerophosphoryl diester phosphodiesterase membrane domain-containing protein [Sphingomonas sp. Leaf33]